MTDLSCSLSASKCNPPTPRTTAKAIRRQLGLKSGRVNVEEVAAQLGVTVDEWRFRGRLQEFQVGNRICVAVGLSDRQRRRLIAHGLGHAVLHDGNVLSMSAEAVDKAEAEAECFAVHLLVDEIDQPADSSRLADYYGVPADLIETHVDPVGRRGQDSNRVAEPARPPPTVPTTPTTTTGWQGGHYDGAA